MTVNSLADLGEAWNMTSDKKHRVRPFAQKSERPRKCRVCGADMEHIAGSNVYVCHGTIEVKKDDGVVETKPCTNWSLSKA